MATFDLTSEQQRHVFEFIQTHPIPSELKVTPVKLQAAFNMAVALARAVEMQPGFTEAGIGPGAALGFVTPTQVGFTVGQLNIASGFRALRMRRAFACDRRAWRISRVYPRRLFGL